VVIGCGLWQINCSDKWRLGLRVRKTQQASEKQ